MGTQDLKLSEKSSYTLHNIQMIRAIAAFLVVLHHAFPAYVIMGGSITMIESVAKWGFLGVDLFFVISGFVMAYTTFYKKRSIDQAKIFLKHRLYRIYLGYWPFFLMMLLALFLANPTKLAELDIAGSFFLTNTNMFELVLPVSWSLTYELCFYFLFVLTFFFTIEKLYTVIGIFFLIVLAVSLSPYVYTLSLSHFPTALNSIHFPYVIIEFFPLLLEFLAGVLLYMYRDTLINFWVLIISLLSLITAYYFGIEYEFRSGFMRVLTFGVGAFFVILSIIILEKKDLFRAGKWFESLGDASYTLYLSHLLTIQFFSFSGLRGLFSSEGAFLPLLGLVCMIAASVIFSLIYYQKIEKPMYRKSIQYGKA